MEELHLGKMTTKELMKWFKVGHDRYYKEKEALFTELRDYCTFKPVYGGIEVTEIKDYVYTNRRDAVYQKVVNYLKENWPDNEPTSATDLTDNLWTEQFEEAALLKQSTIYRYVRTARNELFGNPKYFGKDDSGQVGISTYVLCTRDKKTKKLRFFTKEELKVKRAMLLKHYHNTNEKLAILETMVRTKEIQEEEFYKYYKNYALPKGGGYAGFFKDMKDKGIPVTRGTLVSRNGCLELQEAEFAPWEQEVIEGE